MERKIYETERLELKTLDPADAQLILDYYIRNAAFLEEWEPARGAEFYTKEFHERQLVEELRMMDAGSLFRLWLFKKGEENRVIGSIAFSNIVRGVFLSCYLGYRLDGEEINKGYITEALKKSIEVIFDEYGLHRIEANIIPRNARSLRVTEKLGFNNEGLSPRYLKINGIWEDHIHMVLLNDKL
ncbi:MAG: GNAT family N-acetyltransferase [Clostridiaceae bacterium]|nr:GNAT family N-acetyltransferase [Clostridiaceae bacterium]